MNDRLGGVLMVGAAALIAWAWLTGRLDTTIAQVTAQARKVAPAGTPTGATPASKLGGFGRAGRET